MHLPGQRAGGSLFYGLTRWPAMLRDPSVLIAYLGGLRLAVCGTLYLAKRSFIASITRSCISFSGCFAWISLKEDLASIGSQPLTITLPLRVRSSEAGAFTRGTLAGKLSVPWAFPLSAAVRLFGFCFAILYTCSLV